MLFPAKLMLHGSFFPEKDGVTDEKQDNYFTGLTCVYIYYINGILHICYGVLQSDKNNLIFIHYT